MTFSERLCPSRGLNLRSTDLYGVDTNLDCFRQRSSLRVRGDRHNLDDALPREWGHDTPTKTVAPSAKTKSVNRIRGVHNVAEGPEAGQKQRAQSMP
jgi:hypothetical protein